MQRPGRNAVLNKSHPLVKDLIGCWLFNERTGRVINDYSGNALHTTGRHELVWDAEGVDFLATSAGSTHILHPAKSVFQTVGNRSVVCSASLTDVAAESRFFYVLGEGETEAANIIFGFRYYNTSSAYRLGAFWEHGAGTNDIDSTNPISLVAKQTYTFGLTVDVGSTSTLDYYVDGVLFETTPGKTNASGGQTSFMCPFSQYQSTYSDALKGVGKWCYYFGRKLSADEMRFIHSNPYDMFN